MSRIASRILFLACLLMLLPMSVTGQTSNGRAAPDSRVQVTSPASGQVFSPGDTVNVTVSLTPPLKLNAGWLSVGAPGLGVLQGTNYTGTSYQVSFVIPDAYSGSLTLTPDVMDSNSNPIEGVSVTIIVRSNTPPLSLTLVQGAYNHLLSASATAHIYVTGDYSNKVQRDLTGSVTGTTYTSSDDQVLTVDSEGNVQARSYGTAVVTVTNSGLQAFSTYVVENPNTPLPAQDLTADVNITRLDFRPGPFPGGFVQDVKITNAQATPLNGPLYLVVTDLSRGAIAMYAGKTKTISPAGSPYRALRLPDGITLQPGEHVSVTLTFASGGKLPIDYTTHVYRTLTNP